MKKYTSVRCVLYKRSPDTYSLQKLLNTEQLFGTYDPIKRNYGGNLFITEFIDFPTYWEENTNNTNLQSREFVYHNLPAGEYDVKCSISTAGPYQKNSMFIDRYSEQKELTFTVTYEWEEKVKDILIALDSIKSETDSD